VEGELFLRNSDIALPDTVSVNIALPYVLRKKDHVKVIKLIQIAERRSEVTGFLIRNLEEYQLLKEYGYQGDIVLDAGIYVWNEESLRFWKDKVGVITCPHELNKKEWLDLFFKNTIEKIVYARLPMMITANCISKTSGNCLKGNLTSIASIHDRYKKTFPVMIQCNYCTNVILNTVPMSLHSKECRKWYDSVTKRIHFTIETADEVRDILRFFADVQNNHTTEPPFKEYTAGHEKRGVE
jgi:putative protease